MSATDAVHALLTALFVGAAAYAVRHALETPGAAWRGRVDHLLHAAMAVAMAAMPWGPTLPRTGQTVFFTAAALWFPLTPVRRPRESLPAATARRLPYALGMAAMVWMLRTPHATHHAPAEGESTTGSLVTAALALCLLTCALRSLTRDMPVTTTRASSCGRTATSGTARRPWVQRSCCSCPTDRHDRPPRVMTRR
ncbi:DUF5134 domain-containing protein [Streptomyces brasiliensis]|uniref:DUF5134 domain-containing protein n=1 Tax=Streptomyces brasiliensis TaxID=1954 RepID=A0A917P4I7_9ACTN|nr:DUF5134 domain-containing protein [Streptomyces brasiliensis]GGJ61300.1 DUF5134 domain-containing protein [Streptomyces brasiliensis]